MLMSGDVGVILGSLISGDTAPDTIHVSDAQLFSDHFTSDRGVVFDASGALVFEDGLTIHGDLVVTNASSVTFKGSVQVTGNILIDAETSVVFGNGLTAGGTMTLLSDEVDFLGGAHSARIGGDLILRPHTSALGVGVGFATDSGSTLDLTDSDLQALQLGGKLSIGGGTTGGIVVDSAEFHGDVTIVGSAITVQDSLIANGAKVRLTADGGVVRNDGLINISASTGGAGDLFVSGKYVGNFGQILASGSSVAAGGNVKMISTFQTLISSGASIDVSGAKGGTIYLWSDTNTTMSGQLFARGLASGGDGGFVEVSSAGGFSMVGQVDTTAIAGKTGTLLIDPKNVIISNVGPGTLTTVDAFSDTPSDDVTISATVINTALAAVTIQANNDITVNAALNMNQNLTLQAGRSVIINQDITLANKDLTIIANDAAGVDAQRDGGAAMITTLHGVTINAGSGEINLTLDNGDVGVAGGITVDRVITSGTMTIATAGFLRETTGDVAPTAGAMTTEDDLTAGTLNLVALSADATFGEGLDQGNGALEISAGVLNANVDLPDDASADEFVGYFVLADVDHTNGSAGGINPVITNAPMVIGTMNAGGGSIMLTAKGASIIGQAGPTPNIVATQLNLVTEGYNGPGANSYYGAIGSLNAPLRTNVGMLTAIASDGGVFIAEQDNVLINKIVAQDRGVSPQVGANGSVVVQPAGENPVAGISDARITAGGDIALMEIQVANQLHLSAVGTIADANQDSANILARGLTVNTGGDFGHASDAIDTTVMTLDVTTTNGGVFVNEADGLTVTSIFTGTPGNDVSVTSGAGGINLGVINAIGGNVVVKSGSGSITDNNGAALNIIAESATLEARTGLGTSGDSLEVSAANLSTKVLNPGVGTYLSNSAPISSLSIETNNGAVNMTLNGGSLGFVQPGTQNRLSFNAPGVSSFSFSNTGGSVAINSINAGSGAVTITSKTSIEDHASDTVLDITAGALTLNAGTFIGTAGNVLETNIDTLNANAAAGGIFIRDMGSLDSVTAIAKGTGNDVSISSNGDMVITKVVAPDQVTLDAGGTGNILRSGNVLNVSATTASIHAGGGIGTVSAPLILSVANLTSAVADTGGLFIRAKGAIKATTVRASNSSVDFSSEGNLTIGLVEAGLSDSVSLTSTFGSIIDDNGNAVNIRGGSATLNAAAIGQSGDAIDTDLVSLDATATAGGAYINEIGDINVTRIEARGLGSDIGLTVGGNIVLGVAKADGDRVNIKSISGSISDGNGAALNITADQLDISAPGGIGMLQNSVNKLGSANGGASGVTISNIGALAITDATLEGKGAGMLTIQADSITVLDMADNLALLDPNGSISLVTTNGNVVFLDPNDTIATSGTGSISIQAGLGQTPAYPNTGAVAIVGNLSTAGGTIDVRANHHITIGMLDTGGLGNVTVSSETGVILDGNGAANNINGNVVTLSGVASSARVAQLERDIRIADYSAIRSEAAAKLTNAQSLATGTAIMSVQKQNALQAKENAYENEREAEDAEEAASEAALIAYITATVLDGVATALSIARDIAAIPAGAAQAIPFSGDGGAMTGYSILDVSANAADVAAYAANVVADQLGNIAEEKANDLVQARAEYTALDATYMDSLNTWKAFDEATSVAQKAADAAAIARDHALVVRDQAIYAEDQMNVIGTAANPLGVQARELNASSVDGSVYISVDGDVSLGGVNASGSNGTVSIQGNGDITVTGTTNAPTQVALSAGGAILDGGGLISAPAFVASAENGVGSVANPIRTNVGTVAISAGSGTVGVSNSGAVTIGTVGGIAGISAGGSVGVTSTGSLTISKAISAPGQSVTISSQTGSIVDAHFGSPDVVASSLNVTSATGISLDTSISSLTATVTGAGSITIHEADGITLTSVQTNNGAVSIDAGGDIIASSVTSQTDSDSNDISLTTTNGSIQLGSINAGGNAGDVVLSATGTLNSLVGGQVIADVVTGNTAGDISLNTAANRANLVTTGTGNIVVTEEDAIAIDQLKAVNGASDVSLSAGGTITGRESNDDGAEIVGRVVTLSTTGAGNGIGASSSNVLEINATSQLNASTQGGNAYLTDVSGGVVVGQVNLGAGELHLKALNGSITATNQSDNVADVVASHVNLTVTGASSKIGSQEESDFEIAANTLTAKTDGGNIHLADLSGGIALNTVSAGTGNAFLTAVGGSITDNDGGAVNNVTANKAVLVASNGIGSDGDALELSINAIEAAAGAGGINVTNSANGLTVGGVTERANGIFATGGTVSVTTAGSLSVNETVSNMGNVDLRAGDDVTLSSEASILATGATVAIHGDFGDADADSGSNVSMNGAIVANRLEVTTQGENDSVTLRNVSVSSHSISTGAGNDVVTITTGNALGSGTIDAGSGNDQVTTSTILDNVVGGDGNDQVLIKNGGSVAGQISGGNGYDSVVYDHDGVGTDDFIGPVSVNLQTQSATAIAGFSGINRFEGTSNANDHLIGANTASTWQVTGTNAGNIGGAGTLDFSGFENLTGGTNDDRFQFAAGGSISGNLNGGGSVSRDTIDYQGANFDATSNVVLSGATSGTATGVGGQFSNINEVIGDSDYATSNSLTGNNDPNAWNFTGTNAGNINNAFFFQGIGRIIGGNGANTFAYADGALPPQSVVGGSGYNVLDLSGWTSGLQWNITGDNSGNVVTNQGTFAFSGMSQLLSGSGDDRFVFANNKILGFGLATPGAIDGGAGTDFIDASAYKARNLWTRTGTDGTISTDRGQWTYESIEQFQGSEATTFTFDVVDLTGEVTKLKLAGQLLPNQGGEIFMNLINLGNDEALKQRINVTFYLSADGVLDDSDIVIGMNDGRNINLYQGASNKPFSTVVQVPGDAVAGTYRILAFIDSGKVIAEGDETNNVIDAGSIEVLPVTVDLQPSITKSTLPETVLPGAKGKLTTELKNLGNTAAKGLVNVEYFLSTDGTIDDGDIALGSINSISLNLAPGTSRTFTFQAEIPEGTVAGDYLILTRVVSDTALGETNTSNNQAAAPNDVHVDARYVDLVGTIANAKLPTIAVPNDLLTFKLPIKNLGNIKASGKIDVNFYLSTDQIASPDTDVLLTSLEGISIDLGPNGEKVITASARVPASILGGTFYVVADINAGNSIEESDSSNNSAASAEDMEVVWRFGNFGDRRGVKLVVPDADGNIVTFSMTGEGAGDVLGGSNFTELSLVGTNKNTVVNISTKGGAVTTLHGITSTNPMKALNASKVNLDGNFSAEGMIKNLRLGDISNSIMTFGAGADLNRQFERTILNLGHLENVSINSEMRIHQMNVKGWNDTDDVRDSLTAPRLNNLRSAGDFETDMFASGVDAFDYSLEMLIVKGDLKSEMNLPMGARLIKAGNWVEGSFTGRSIDSLTVKGDLTNTTFEITGFNKTNGSLGLGSAKIGGSVQNTVISVQGSAGVVKVGNWDSGSVLAVGVNSGGDGTFFDGNETALGGKLGAFYAKAFSTDNSGTAFGIAVDSLASVIQLKGKSYRTANLPAVEGDLNLVIL